METFSEMLVRVRQEKGLSVRELEKLLKDHGYKISFGFINFLERERKKPTYNVAYALADVLGIDIEEALTKAYLARMGYSERLERDYLKKLIQEKSLRGIDIDNIFRASTSG